jgi:hypothetical protein
MPRITSEWMYGMGEELCACFIDYQKTFNCIKWTKFMQILNDTGINWHERRPIRKFYMDQRVKLREYQGDKVWRLKEKLEKGAVTNYI